MAFLSTTGCGTKALFLKHYAEELASDWLIGPSVLQQMSSIQTFITRNCGGISSTKVSKCGIAATVKLSRSRYSVGTCVAPCGDARFMFKRLGPTL